MPASVRCGGRCSTRCDRSSTGHSASASRSTSAPPAAPPPTVTAEASTSTTSMPPDSFAELVAQAASATDAAIADGSYLMEVDFPPLPVSKLEDPSLSAYDLPIEAPQVFRRVQQGFCKRFCILFGCDRLLDALCRFARLLHRKIGWSAQVLGVRPPCSHPQLGIRSNGARRILVVFCSPLVLLPQPGGRRSAMYFKVRFQVRQRSHQEPGGFCLSSCSALASHQQDFVRSSGICPDSRVQSSSACARVLAQGQEVGLACGDAKDTNRGSLYGCVSSVICRRRSLLAGKGQARTEERIEDITEERIGVDRDGQGRPPPATGL